jgi:hypothetical protein
MFYCGKIHITQNVPFYPFFSILFSGYHPEIFTYVKVYTHVLKGIGYIFLYNFGEYIYAHAGYPQYIKSILKK